METKLQRAFKHLQEKCGDCFELVGDYLLVEEIPREEVKSPSGLIVSAPMDKISRVDGMEANRPIFVRVLLVGNGYYDTVEEAGEKIEKTIPLDVKVDDILLVGRLSVKWLSYFGPLVSSSKNNLGILREGEKQLRFFGDEAYQRVYDTLNKFNVEENNT
jgi:hypothetical protein